ncbi:protein kinase family protein [Kitasatospora azatica]|uniref:protein kinase family protein n=1 Tax=Kitasatospora azatica TaxID=58347 RepID=UPI000AFD024B|nr:protein kinase family protein [Kitasatospora azatica]
MADRTKDRTKAAVEMSAAEATGEITAPLSAAEIAAELAEVPAEKAENAEPVESAEPDAEADSELPEDAADSEDAEAAEDSEAAEDAEQAEDSEEAEDTEDGLPEHLPVPTRHSGDRIAGRYRLEECISRTSVFSSWRAVDEKLRRAVGVHLLAAGSARAEGVLAAARSAALLGDPRFVQVLDAVQEGELVYVIREWLPDATDLATLLAPGPMEPYDAYQMVRQVTEAIATAHRGGRSHLRLTPRCVLRTDTGQYRINGVAVDAALRGIPAQPETTGAAAAELADTRAIGTLLYAALTHRWPHPEDRYDLKGLPKDLGLVAPDQVRAGVHRGMAELAARTLCDPPPRHLSPITSPAALAKEIALLPRIRQSETDQGASDRYPAPGQTVGRSPRPALARTEVLRPVHPGPAGYPHPTSTQPTPSRPRPGRRRMARKLLNWTVSAVLLAAIGYGSWQLAGRLGTNGDPKTLGASGPGLPPSATASTTAPTPLQLTGVTSFNPFGDHPMHTELLPNTHDNDPNTAWQTDGYFDDLPTLGHGTGLLVDLGSTKQVSSIAVQFVGSTAAELRVPGAAGDTEPTKFDDFGQPVAKAGADGQFQLGSPVRTRYLLIWLTSLPKDGTGRYRGQVAEIKVTG